MKQTLLFCILLCTILSCKSRKQDDDADLKEPAVSNLSGRELSIAHCSRCHLLVSPQILPKASWQKVLPAMGQRMGIYAGVTRPDSLFNPKTGGSVVKSAHIFPEKPIISKADWQKIEQYYLDNAPDSIPAPVRSRKIQLGLRHFKYRKPPTAHRPALTTMVKILPDKQGIVFSDGKGKQKKMTFLNPRLEAQYTIALPSAPVHFYQTSKELYVTTIGNTVFPTDAAEGSVQRWVKGAAGYALSNTPVSNLRRPVNMAYGDLNNDGFEDIVACEFGNETGQLAWYANNGRGGYDKRVLNERPGAITAIIKDANGDKLPDIYVLMAQADEGILLYENQGQGQFKEKRLLTFSPLNGSQYMELADFNKDGFDDIIYVCGDNADKTPILKDYHGVYIYLNDGKSNFKQAYFYQLNGAYKAMARDYDLDGDLDIAAISFFPDYKRYPHESFVYLENKGRLKFRDYSFPESPEGRWSVMDAGDMDGDGDTDIVLGSFVYFIPKGDKTGLGQKWLSDGPSVIVLENTVK
ncbi:FG-GAP repeat domain-containing protein [Dyadobacter aurulentus]|uniref:FG-GAP repeat domain-containing protein n=1 Tax=Dyadobacter sp. UC 10 TaxID=2605428 RepID=UPI0011F0C581|nr:VCBS repeat-containing protein [Dyadobacter sp. UC 10]KAA0993682.1 VCBS repeat-containing protein [Dyadobacter sp. UC 10]